MLNRKAAVIVIIVTVVMLGVVLADAGSRGSGPSVPVKPVPTVNNPTSYPLLSDFWNGNAYFEKTQYVVSPSILLDEAAPFPNPGTAGTGPNTVYTYYRSHNAPHDGIGLAISNDGGATYSLYNNGVPVVSANSNSCGWDASNVIMPSVVKVGLTFFMVYEGASILTLSNYTACSIYYLTFGDIGLATSTDGINWQKYNGAGLFLQHNSDQSSFGCQNIGAPSVSYTSGQFYIFFHGDCGAASGAALITLCTNLNIAGLVCSHGLTACPLTFPNTATSCPYGFRFDGLRNKVGMVHAAGTDLTALHDSLQSVISSTNPFLQPVMDIGVGAQSWDSRVNGRANVIQEGGYYYMFFEGSQYVFTTTYDSIPFIGGQGVSEGNWGWGVARTSNISNGPWEKFQYNPIDQLFQNQGSGGGMQQPYVYYLNGAYRVYIWNTGQSAYNSAVLLSGTDPYLHYYPAINGGNGQCQKYHRIGFVDGDGWAQTTGVNNDYLCYGPYQNVLGSNDYSSLWNTWTPGAGGIPAGNYAVTFRNMIDSTSCAGDFPPGVCAPIATLDITHNNGNFRDSILVPYRNDYQFSYGYQDFEQQFAALKTDLTINSPLYEWRTFFDSHAYLRAHGVFLRQLDGRYDTTAPTASMNSLPSTSAAPSFQVSWSGSDDRTGIWSFDVQYQDNGQGWNPWQPGTTSTSATFSSAACFHTYDFRVQARDNSGYTSGYSAQTSTYVACDFGISVSPGSSTINPGGTATSTVTLTSFSGFSGAVNLSPSVSPAGPIASVSPTNPSVTPGGTGTSTLTVTTISGTSTGIYTVTIQGTSGPVSHSATFTLTVLDLTLSASPSSIPADLTTVSTITAQLSNNAQGVTVSFSTNFGYFPSAQPGNPASCTTGSTGSCSVTIESIQAGVATITVSASGYPTHQVSVTFFDFSETVSPSVISTIVGTTTTATVSLAPLNGFAGTISLATNVMPNPAGMACSVSPSSVTLGTSATATVTCKPTQPGIYTVVVFASSGTLTHGPTISYTVQDFTLATNSLSIDGTASAFCGHNTNSCQTVFSTSRNNDIVLVYTYEALDLQPVCTFGVTDTAGLTWHFRAGVAGRNDGWYNPTPRDQLGEFWASSTGVLTSDTITESISGCASTQYGGEYNGLQVFGISGANINNPFDPNASLPGTANNYSNTPSVTMSTTNPNDMIIAIAQQTSYGVLTPGPGFIGGPSNTEYAFPTSTVTNFPVTFGDNYVWYWEEIADAITPSSAGTNAGLSAAASITVTGVNGFAGTVALTDSPLPAGLTCSAITPASLTLPPSPTAATLSCTSTVAGIYSVTVTATSGLLTHQITIPMSFNDFSLTASTTSLTITHGSSGRSTLTLTSLNGFSGTINLSATISGASYKGPFIVLSSSSVACSNGSPGTSVLTVNTFTNTPKGTYTVTVTATSGTLTHTVVITVTVI